MSSDCPSPPTTSRAENSSGEDSGPSSPEGGVSLHIGVTDVPLTTVRFSDHTAGHIASHIDEPDQTLNDDLYKFQKDRDHKDFHGRTTLLYFTQHTAPILKSIKGLIEAEYSPNDACPKKCCTPLINVTKRADLNIEEHKKAIKYLTGEGGAHVNLNNSRYGSVLNKACYDGNLAMVKFLIQECGADPNFTSNGLFGSALQAACLSKATKEGIYEMIRYLCNEAGVKINTESGFFGTALNITCLLPPDRPWMLIYDHIKGDSTIPDQMGRLPIHFAAVFSYRRFQLICQKPRLKVPLSSTDKTGRTVLHWAAQSGEAGTVEAILSSRAVKVDQPDNDGWTALCWAARGLTSGAKFEGKAAQSQAKIIDHLLKYGADKTVSVRGDAGQSWTPLQIAIFHNSGKHVIAALTASIPEEETSKLLTDSSFRQTGYVHGKLACICCRSPIIGTAWSWDLHEFKKSDSVFGEVLDKEVLKTWMKR
ncbi:hypothetical protein CNYM01_11128 [Colletotrichum nymphaeae SA-01]|uniref:Uncharacterized protein n=1 Tax=Colletotrichum nymphaeae SA-01 TaxID=1460502 RepID=A0A135RNJ6_9PEZI|nr:hypothetical protein CNYM01_11128 [Colletotrichum nymphaeae SA-01]